MNVTKITPAKMRLMQDIDTITMDIEVAIVGYDMLMPMEKKYINSYLDSLYTKRSLLKSKLRTMQ